MGSEIDPALVAGNQIEAAGYHAKNFGWEVLGKVALVTLDRPERKNPLTFASYAELRDLFRAAQIRNRRQSRGDPGRRR